MTTCDPVFDFGKADRFSPPFAKWCLNQDFDRIEERTLDSAVIFNLYRGNNDRIIAKVRIPSHLLRSNPTNFLSVVRDTLHRRRGECAGPAGA
jgi:hypothetical protein